MTRPAFVLLDRARLRSAGAADPDLLALRLGTAALCRVSAVTLDRWRKRGLGPGVVRLPGADVPCPIGDVRALVEAAVADASAKPPRRRPRPAPRPRPPAPLTEPPDDDGPPRRTFTEPPL